MANDSLSDYTTCVICCLELADKAFVTLTLKGLTTLKEYCSKRSDEKLAERLRLCGDLVKVHTDCRKKYTDHKRLSQTQGSQEDDICRKKVLRSSGVFDFKQQCFFCAETAVYDCKHPERNPVCHVATLQIRNNVLDYCLLRNDQWGLQVRGRLQLCDDLVAPEAVYHKKCHQAFHRPVTNASVGRPENTILNDAFNELCDWLEMTDAELYTLPELQEKLESFACGSDSVYSAKHLKRKLEERFGDHIFFAGVNGRKNVVCFKNMAGHIISDKWYCERENSAEDESVRIVRLAARLIKASIRDSQLSNEIYPGAQDLKDTYQVSHNGYPVCCCFF
jgi:hypothetical protein